MKSFKYVGTFLVTAALLTIQGTVTKTLARENSKDSITPSRKDAIAFMKSVCGKGNFNSNNPESCNRCPSFTGGSGSGTLTSVVYGSFTKAGVNEAFVDLEGCEPHAGNWGGSVLLRRTNNGWSFLRYEQGLRSDRCLKFKTRVGRSSLVCEGSYTQGGFVNTWLDALEIGSTKNTTTRLLKVTSNIGSCRPPYYEMQVADFKLQDTNKDGKNDLVIKVNEAREKAGISRSDDQLCDTQLPKPNLHQLTFLFNGQSFRPTTETAKFVKRVSQ